MWITAVNQSDFEDALLNLSLNAHDAMPNGGKLTITTCNKVLPKLNSSHSQLSSTFADNSEFVMMSITDTGIGMSKEVIERVLEPFFTTKAQGKGTGLGLSMVFGFVTRSKGYIKVDSELCIGTTFRLYLPRNESLTSNKSLSVNPHETTQPTQPTDACVQALKGHEKILLVDDEAYLLDLAQYTLDGLGYETLRATTAQEAIEKLILAPDIALVFSDIVMPGKMTGFDLAEKISADFRNTKVLLTSGYTGKAPVQHDSLKSDFKLLSKPYAQMDMAAKIRKCLNESSPSKGGTITPSLDYIIAWNDELLTGIELIDEDHRHLFFLLDKLQKIHSQEGAASMAQTFKEFTLFSDRHFKREELIMEICEYPHLKNHRQVNYLLMKQIKAKQEALLQGHVEVKEVLDFFIEWFTEHIKSFDMGIKLSFSKNEAQINIALKALNLEMKRNCEHE